MRITHINSMIIRNIFVDVFDEHEKAVYRDKHWQYVVAQVYCLAMEYAMNGSIHISESRPDSKDNSSHV